MRAGPRQQLSGQPARDWRLDLLETMLTSREADVREDILFRQGRGQFHVASAGHESLAVLAACMIEGDWIFSHYRDKALMLARGVPLEEIALGFFAKDASNSGGRQLVCHFSDKTLNIPPAATPTGLQCLPAAGVAWSLVQAKSDNIVFCNIGDASTRQGEFFEAIAFAIQEKLPLVYVVEDNGYGISTPTEKLSPLNLGMLPAHITRVVDGRDAISMAEEVRPLIENVRKENGPLILWVKLDRLSSHTGSDDQGKYRQADELEEIRQRDALSSLRRKLTSQGMVSEGDIGLTAERIKAKVRSTYQAAESAANPAAQDSIEHVFSNQRAPSGHYFSAPAEVKGGKWTMASAVNSTFNRLLEENPSIRMFGEDIEDPKGGVFGLTKGLSIRHPGRVTNSPLAEATIAGLASGMAMTGTFPIFELQFVDFIGPAFNQIVNQIATLNWRSRGQFKCPMLIYAPCGSYISGGGPWHSQTNESWLAHTPGLKVYMPGNANDAANLIYTAAYGHDPVIMLLPKYQFQRQVDCETDIRLYPERARVVRSGKDVTLVAWGNCVEIAERAAEELSLQALSVEILDLCSIVPCDYQAIFSSVKKTGRLVIVQEDNRTCSFGQAIISEVCSRKDVWDMLYAPPKLVSRGDVLIGFSKSLEQAVLPSVSDVCTSALTVMGRGA